MLKKRVFFTAIFSVLLLTACGNTGSESSDNTDQSEEENTEEVEPDQEDENSSEESDEEDTNDSGQEDESEETDPSAENDSSEQEIDQVKETEYSSEEEAIEDYQELEDTNVDLGHGIEGFIEGAAGHQYITWNEGKWYFEIDFPSDPQYAIEDYEDGEELARAIVDYLEDNMLPPPDERGLVKIRAFADEPETLIQWQEGTTVYEINGETSDPIDTLQIAVDYQNNR